MKRREMLAAGSIVLTAGCMEFSSPSPNAGSETNTHPDKIPKPVRENEELAADFQEALSELSNESRAFLNREGEIIIEYQTSAESSEALQTEFNQVADLYYTVIEEKEHSPTVLSIVVGEVQAIVTEDAVQARLDGDLDKEAYLETVEVTDR